MTVRPFLTIQMSPDHAQDICAHLRTTLDRLQDSNRENSLTPCLGHHIHEFSKFEFLNIQKTVNGHFNGKNLEIVSRLITPQKGLSIHSLWVEKSICEVDHVFTPLALGVTLNRRSTFVRDFENPVLKVPKFLGFMTFVGYR